LPGGTLTALKRDKGSLAAEILWENNKLAPGNASPLVYRDRVYVLNKAGVFTCANVADGQIVWQTRLKGPFWATPVIAGDHAYCVNQDGLGQVVKLSETKGEIVGEGNFEEPVLGTPAIANGALYVRSQGHLWKISKR
ncbi:MAG: PQQ-binding-like beta-propeller repeat protein, partial [Pirellulales bacterium]